MHRDHTDYLYYVTRGTTARLTTSHLFLRPRAPSLSHDVRIVVLVGHYISVPQLGVDDLAVEHIVLPLEGLHSDDPTKHADRHNKRGYFLDR
jgi:hypothetical protein